MATTIKSQILGVLGNATSWLSANEIRQALRLNRNSIRRCLTELTAEGRAFKILMPGESRKHQWASSSLAANLKSFATNSKSIKLKAKRIGDLNMQIEQGVEAVVADLVTAGKKFTAHDVTKDLRDRVNAGTLSVDPGLAGTAHVNGKDVTKIEHSLVRDAVHTLMTGGKYPAYDRAHTGTFFEYFPAPVVPPAAAAPSDPGTPPASDGGSYDGNPTL